MNVVKGGRKKGGRRRGGEARRYYGTIVRGSFYVIISEILQGPAGVKHVLNEEVWIVLYTHSSYRQTKCSSSLSVINPTRVPPLP